VNRIRTLILGGTSESLELAAALAREERYEPTLSLAGVTREPRQPPVPWRSGGFGGASGLADHLVKHSVRLLIAATHPFAAQMRRNAVEAARITGCALLILERPRWVPGDGERWLLVPDINSAATALGPTPRRVLLTVGRKELASFQSQPQHAYLIRAIEPPAPEHLPPNTEVILARGPFSEEQERELLVTHRIERLVTKNSGGPATEPKLHAARHCGVTVVMVERPPMPSLAEADAHIVDSVPAALAWLRSAHTGLSSIRRGV
jgi:precorrin-6A/cobalt-precorrin-6A reductase